MENLCAKLENYFSKLQVNSIQKKLREKPLVFLFNSGHCGIDYMQSLLDSHHQILITPEYSFLRSWNEQIEGGKIQDPDEMFLAWEKFFKRMHWINHADDQQFLHSEQEFEVFFEALSKKITLQSMGKVDIFWAIHESYCIARSINIESIKMIIAQEHLNFYFEQSRLIFPESKVILMMRDPRASFGGIFHKMGKIQGYITDGTFNFFTQQWIQAQKIWKYLSKLNDERYKIVKLEELQIDKESKLIELAAWLGVDFNESILRSTYPHTAEWEADTCYKVETKKIPDDFFSQENIQKRWMNVLKDQREILMIESLLDQTMRKFEYDRLTKKTLLSALKGFYYYFNYPRGKIARMVQLYPNMSQPELMPQKLQQNERLMAFWRFLPSSFQFLGFLFFSLLVRVKKRYVSV